MAASKRTQAILEPFLIGSEQPNGDIDARCPLHKDNKRSARINFEKGMWICFAGCGSGSLSSLLKRMRVETDGDPEQANTRKVKRQRRLGSRRVASINPKVVHQWHLALMQNEDVKHMLWSMRGINEDTMQKFAIGWDQAGQAFSLPVYLDNGDLFNVRMYRPNAPSDKKIWWLRRNSSQVPLYPVSALRKDKWAVLCEGEMDALLATQNGLPAVSGTAGAGTWHVDWSESFRDMDVFIAYDRDSAGEKGARQVAEHLEPFANSIYIVTIPINKKGADVSDFFLEGKDRSDFLKVLRKSQRYQKRVQDPTKMEPIDVSVMNSFDSQNVGRAQSMNVLISGRSKEPYTLPKVVTSSCTMDAGPKCSVCPMLDRKGEHTFEVSPSSQHLLAMLDSPKSAVNDSLRQACGAVKCDRLVHEVKSHQTVEQLYVRPSWDETSGDFTPRRINSVGKHDTMPSQVVRVTGTTWPDPKEQHNQFLAWDVAEAENAIDEFKVTPDVVRELKQFRPKGVQSPLQKLGHLAKDLEQHVTRIYGRLDLHMAIDLTFMSITSFPFQGKLERRGWLDVLVVGDTRTGKSEVAQRMVEHYGVGQFVNCEAATFAGIIGGLQQMADRQWAVTWGVVPMSDRRLVVLDEASGLTPDQIASMSDVRSRGVIRLQKIQAEQAWARTRLVWLSNPRDESMDRYMYGMQSIQPLIGNREDIARFDFAMALNARDVDRDAIYQAPSSEFPDYESESFHRRVMWAWSRGENDVEWDDGVEADVLRGAEWLGDKYVSDPPLVQSANAHVKLARLAVAMASSVFSTDSSGKRIIVKREHVRDALKMIDYLYSKETFGYATMSERAHSMSERANENLEEAKRYLLENRMMIEFLHTGASTGAFRSDMLEHMLNLPPTEANAVLYQLFKWGLVTPNGHTVKVQPALHALLRDIEKEDR